MAARDLFPIRFLGSISNPAFLTQALGRCLELQPRAAGVHRAPGGSYQGIAGNTNGYSGSWAKGIKLHLNLLSKLAHDPP